MVDEFELIEEFRWIIERYSSCNRLILKGAGQDDCACIGASGNRRLLLTVDDVVEDVHFVKRCAPPELIGMKAASCALSDIASMGGIARWALISAGVNFDRWSRVELVKIVEGIVKRFYEFGAFIVGGNISYSEKLFLSITVVGECRGRYLSRAGAVAGELIGLTGAVGRSALGFRMMKEKKSLTVSEIKRNPFLNAHFIPPVRIKEGLILKEYASSCIDVSDGLVQDLCHICRSSNVGAVVEIDRIPLARGWRRFVSRREAIRAALCGGEDYELLFSISRKKWQAMKKRFGGRVGSFSIVGEIVSGEHGVKVVDKKGKQMDFSCLKGWNHGRASRKG